MISLEVHFRFGFYLKGVVTGWPLVGVYTCTRFGFYLKGVVTAIAAVLVKEPAGLVSTLKGL
ncbi:hypothetical protein [Thermanaeromonas toyohensis]|uniref:hypothetical protein n=1 Tax=Thermanaeromonas toyohensis TaxID=161154 RepID=UPI003BF5DFD5